MYGLALIIIGCFLVHVSVKTINKRGFISIVTCLCIMLAGVMIRAGTTNMLYGDAPERYSIIKDGEAYTCTNDKYGRECYDRDGVILGDEYYWRRRDAVKRVEQRQSRSDRSN